MKLIANCIALTAMVLVSCGRPQTPAFPAWVSERFDLLRRLGIDPVADLVETANYHWSWTSRHAVVAGLYRCPVGSSVDVSRSIVVVRAPSSKVCRSPGGESVQTLKVFRDGTAEPLGGEGS